MDTGKYVVVKYWVCDMMAVIFPAAISHDDFVRRTGFTPDDIDSAGFVSFGRNAKGKTTVSCYGKSSSLGKESKPERDSSLCTRLFRDPLFED